MKQTTSLLVAIAILAGVVTVTATMTSVPHVNNRLTVMDQAFPRSGRCQ